VKEPIDDSQMERLIEAERKIVSGQAFGKLPSAGGARSAQAGWDLSGDLGERPSWGDWSRLGALASDTWGSIVCAVESRARSLLALGKVAPAVRGLVILGLLALGFLVSPWGKGGTQPQEPSVPELYSVARTPGVGYGTPVPSPSTPALEDSRSVDAQTIDALPDGSGLADAGGDVEVPIESGENRGEADTERTVDAPSAVDPESSASEVDAAGLDSPDFRRKIAPVARLIGERPLTEEDLDGLSPKMLTILRNLPYAVHGYRFRREDLLREFQKLRSYSPNTNDLAEVGKRMTELERTNAGFINDYQARHGLQW